VVSNAVLLFLVIDPFGLIPVYVAALGRVAPERRVPILLRELLIALAALVAFLFAGKYLLALLRISESSLEIAGGLILFLIALPMIFPSVQLRLDADGTAEPFIVPLATPLFAGPSALTLVMLIGSEPGSAWPEWLGTVFAAWLCASIVLLLGNAIAHKIGARGLIALERLMGMLLVAMAVEMLLSGLAEYFGLARGA
jgi:MarC family membrane protein